MKDNNRTLLSLFDPPTEDTVGIIGAVCGYSMSPDFAELMVEKFTKKSLDAISSKGDFCLLLALDKGKGQIGHIPGLYQMLRKPNTNSFDLLHAKIGILAFGKNKHDKIRHLRCFVTTGNFTRNGIRENLDLVWTVDITLEDKGIDKQDKADASKIFRFFKDLESFYSIPEIIRNQFFILNEIVNSWSLKDSDLKKSRFITNLDLIKKESMFSLIAEVFKKADPLTKHNTLICGSGFFESQNIDDEKLEVFEQIEKQICTSRCYVQSKSIDGFVVINYPKDSGKFKNLNFDSGRINWNVQKAKDFSNFPEMQLRKFLHSKYIFSGHFRNGNYINCIIYIGSANLTKKGMLYSLGNSQSNIEAGVIIELEKVEGDELYMNLSKSDDVVNREEIEKTAFPVDDFDEGIPVFSSPIISIQLIDEVENKYSIEWDNNLSSCSIVNCHGELVPVDYGTEKICIELSKQAFMAKVSWNNNESVTMVPIFGNNGSFCQSPPHELSAEEAIFRLLSFPDDEVISNEFLDDESDSDEREFNSVFTKINENLPSRKRYISLAAELVENIAKKNQIINKGNVLSWVENLEFVLCQCVTKSEIRNITNLELNIFEVLKMEHFSPNWEAMNADPEIIKKYNNTIDFISQSWGTSKYSSLGKIE